MFKAWGEGVSIVVVNYHNFCFLLQFVKVKVLLQRFLKRTPFQLQLSLGAIAATIAATQSCNGRLLLH